MKLSIVLPALVVTGLILLVLAFAWPHTASPESSWTMEDYQEYRDALATGHEISHELEEASAGSLDAVKKRDKENRLNVERFNQKLKDARDGPQNVVLALKWSGIALILLGGVGMFVRRSAEGQS